MKKSRRIKNKYKTIMSRQDGLIGEQLFKQELLKLNFPKQQIKKVDSWFDYKVLNEKVEIKTSSISIYNGNAYRIGRFDFTRKENRIKQRRENIWVCFIVRFKRKFLMLGLCRARQLKKKRYVSIHETQDLKLTSLKDWVKKHGF